MNLQLKSTKNLKNICLSPTTAKKKEESVLPNSLYKASIVLVPKSDENTTKQGKYRPTSLMSTDVKILNKILENEFKILNYIQLH